MTAPPAGGDAAAGRPLLRVVSGDATPEEIAAVVAAISLGAATAAAVASEGPERPATPRTTSVWSAPGYAHRNIRATFTPGPDGWRTSFWPR